MGSCAGDRHDVVRDALADPADVHVVGVANLGGPALGVKLMAYTEP